MSTIPASKEFPIGSFGIALSPGNALPIGRSPCIAMSGGNEFPISPGRMVKSIVPKEFWMAVFGAQAVGRSVAATSEPATRSGRARRGRGGCLSIFGIIARAQLEWAQRCSLHFRLEAGSAIVRIDFMKRRGQVAYAFQIDTLVEHQETHLARIADTGEYSLAPAIENALAIAIEEAVEYDRFADMGKHVIRTIHAVPQLHDTDGSKIELYLGRSGATPSHVYGRFSSHVDTKEHHGGTVVALCPTSKVTLWEGAAVRVLNQLRRRGKLCVANVACHGGGALPNTRDSIIYLTWMELGRRQRLSPITRNDIDVVSRDVAEAIGGEISEDSLSRALDPVTRPVLERADLEWAPRMRSSRTR